MGAWKLPEGRGWGGVASRNQVSISRSWVRAMREWRVLRLAPDTALRVDMACGVDGIRRAPSASPAEGVNSYLVPTLLGHPFCPKFSGQGEPHSKGGKESLSPSWGSSHPASVSLTVGSLLQRGCPQSLLGSPYPWRLLDGGVFSLWSPKGKGPDSS